MRSLTLALLLTVGMTWTANAGDQGRLAGLMSPSKPAAQSMIIKAGSCTVTCGGKTSNKSCSGTQSCSCYCDGRGDAVCGDCK
jgi:hypothetical protein